MNLEFRMLNEIQKQEIRRLAESIIEFDKWEALPWSDAWNGAYPLRPTRNELEREAKALEIKAIRIISGGPLADEYIDSREHLRMICLESAETLNIYA